MTDSIIGLIPAAGRARRLGRLGYSKELHPIDVSSRIAKSFYRPPTVVSDVLLEAFRRARIINAVVVVRDSKRDIIEHIGDGGDHGLCVQYATANESPGVPWTVNAAYSRVQGKTVAFGFPDMLFSPVDLFTPLLRRLFEQDADVVLGLLPADRPEKVDIVITDSTGVVTRIVPKPRFQVDGLAWIAAVWKSRFSTYIHDLIGSRQFDQHSAEVYMGDIIQNSISEFKVIAVPFTDGRFLDVGTPDDLKRAIMRW